MVVRRVSLQICALTLLAVAMLALAQPATAEVKIGVVNIELVVSESKSGKAARAEMEQLQEGKRQKLEAKRKEIMDLKKRIDDGHLSLAKDLLDDLREDYDAKVVDFGRMEDDANRELKKRSEKLLKEIEQKVLPVIDRVGKEQGFSLIFNKFQSGLVYADDTVEITEAVISALNAESGSGS